MAQILMLCHDQHLDRRVVAQAASLIKAGHQVTLLALAFGPEREESETPEGIRLVRIGLNSIVPSNPTYRAYLARQYRLNDALNFLCNRMPTASRVGHLAFRWASKFNWQIYRLGLLLRYRNLNLADPLPFTTAFVNVGMDHPAEVVQVHDLPALEAGAQLAGQWQVPLVYDAHELYPEQRAFSAVQRRICSENETHWISKARLVFAVNASIGDEMAKRYGIVKPVTLLNAIDPPHEFNPLAKYDLLRGKLSLPDKRRILLFQGGFSPNRNLERLIDAMALVKSRDVDLVMMGFGNFGEKLKSQAERLGLLGKRIHFLPAVPQSELLQHSASADIGIIPYPHVDLNSYYCTPNKLFEFIQAGLPILANASPELERFVSGNGFGMTAPMKNCRQIAEAIDAAFNSQARSGWRTALLNRRPDFSWQPQEEIYLQEFLKVLAIDNGVEDLASDEVAA